MNLHVVYAAEGRKPEYFAYLDYVLAAFRELGARVVDEKNFLLQPEISPDDKLVCFFASHQNSQDIFSTVKPQNRWSYVIDEGADLEGRAYKGRLEFFKSRGVERTIVTYQSPQHLHCLNEANIKYVTIPCCVPRQRRRVPKPHGILAAGTFDQTAYPVRFKIRNLLSQADNHQEKIVHKSIKTAMGDAYYDILDQYQLGITCKVDYRDRMVQKYVEFGMCHVLPIGDCPSYMPEDMKRLMVNVAGMSDIDVVLEVKRLLNNPQELTERQEAYSSLIHERYDLLTNVARVIKQIKSMLRDQAS